MAYRISDTVLCFISDAIRLTGRAADRMFLPLCVLFAIFWISTHAPPTERVGVRSVTVDYGDTLFGIADANYQGNLNQVIYEIRVRNGLTSATLTPGQVLILP